MNLKKIDALLIQKAINSAKLHGDEYNHFRYSQMEGKKITPAERRRANAGTGTEDGRGPGPVLQGDTAL